MSIRRPRLKILRRLATPLPGLTRKSAHPDALPPGASAATTAARSRRRPSAHRRRLEEKQKVRFNYGVTERQLRRSLEAARRMPGRTGENLLLLLERRLDNVVFRLGLAPTIPAARQLVGHGHVQVGGRRVDRPGYLLSVGETVSLGPAARRRPALLAPSEHGPMLRVPGYLQHDPTDRCAGRILGLP
ncbi:MAG: 30S ribosomal protein S4, partial [Gemmatimonadaceae bacterium]